MSESDRIQLMVMVKEGKISTEEALQEVCNWKYAALGCIWIFILAT